MKFHNALGNIDYSVAINNISGHIITIKCNFSVLVFMYLAVQVPFCFIPLAGRGFRGLYPAV